MPNDAQQVADAAGHVGHREQEVLGRQVLVVELLAFLVGGLEDAERARRESCASRTVAPLTCGSLAERFVDAGAHRAEVDADAFEHAGDDAFGLVEQRAQQVLGRDLGVARRRAPAPARRRTPPGSCG